jgi:hypothetical protein
MKLPDRDRHGAFSPDRVSGYSTLFGQKTTP